MFLRQEESTRRDQRINLLSGRAEASTASRKWYEINQFLCVEGKKRGSLQLQDVWSPELVSSLPLTSPRTHCRQPQLTLEAWCPGDLEQGPLALSIARQIDTRDRHVRSQPLSVPEPGLLDWSGEGWPRWPRVPWPTEPAHPQAHKHELGAILHTGYQSPPKLPRSHPAFPRKEIK